MPPDPATTGTEDAKEGRRRWRWAFAAYGVALSTLLLWPALTVPPVVQRPDLIAHCTTFGLFTWLAFMALREGGRRAGWAIVLALLGGVAYGGITELLQGIPALKRTCALDDFLADDLGVALGVVGAAGTALWSRRRRGKSR